MGSKLENKLLQYEKSTPISNDEEMIKAIECIISKEESLVYEDRDFDLIDEAIEAILSLKKVDIEQLDECADNITEKCLYEIQTNNSKYVIKTKPKSVRLKWLIPIAVIISVLTVGTVVAYAFGFDLISMTKEAYTQLVEKVLYKQGDNELIITNNVKEYNSLSEFIKNEDCSGLILPCELPDEYTIDNIYLEDYGVYKNIALFLVCNGKTHEITIQSPCSNDYNHPEKEIQVIGNFDVYYSQYDDKHQGEFMNEGNYYAITSSSYESLKTIIKSMEN